MRILYVTTVGSMMGFFRSFIKMLIKEGHTVDIACNDTDGVPCEYKDLGCRIYKLSCDRSPFCTGNIKAIKEIKQLVRVNAYDIVHCHSPIASICTRLGCMKLRKDGVKVIYTAHGFHFYKGAPFLNWALYFPVERFCSRFTDALITINQEDYNIALNKMKAKRTLYVPGVGINLNRYRQGRVDRNAKRKEIGVPTDATMLLSLGELNENKNHECVIYAIARMENKNVHYVVAGKGKLKSSLEKLADDLGIGHRVHLLGYRRDVLELCKSSDIYVHPSFREGLPVSIMEAMACGLPVIASDIRGNTELARGEGGLLFPSNNIEECKECIENLMSKDTKMLGMKNMERLEPYSEDVINSQMIDIYRVV